MPPLFRRSHLKWAENAPYGVHILNPFCRKSRLQEVKKLTQI